MFTIKEKCLIYGKNVSSSGNEKEECERCASLTTKMHLVQKVPPSNTVTMCCEREKKMQLIKVKYSICVTFLQVWVIPPPS